MKNAEAIEYIKKNCYGEWCEDDWREAMDMAIEALKCSETPKSSERTVETAQNVKDGDLISRKAVIDLITDADEITNFTTKGVLKSRVRKLPSAQPEIIRCKECRYKELKGVDYYCDHITGEEIMVSPNDYCSWAERRTE